MKTSNERYYTDINLNLILLETPLKPLQGPLGNPWTVVFYLHVWRALHQAVWLRQVSAGACLLSVRYRCNYWSADQWAGQWRGPGASKWHYFSSERPPGERSDSTYQQLEKLTLTPRHQHTHNQLHLLEHRSARCKCKLTCTCTFNQASTHMLLHVILVRTLHWF